MPSQEFSPEWVLSNSSSKTKEQSLRSDDELIAVASRLWPRVQAHARKELANKNPDESAALAAEVWESVLQSVSKTLRRRNGKASGIVDLEAYLFGAFHHRFNRALKKERRRQETIGLVPSTVILQNFRGLGTRNLRALWRIQSRSKRSSRIWTTGHARSGPPGNTDIPGGKSQSIWG